MHTLHTALIAASLYAAWRFPTRTRILGSPRKERDPATRNHSHAPHTHSNASSNRSAVT